jgi:hypothetical protein
MANMHFVLTARRMVGGRRKRMTDLVGPFDSYLDAAEYRDAWLALWAGQYPTASIEIPFARTDCVVEWYREKQASGALAPD